MRDFRYTEIDGLRSLTMNHIEPTYRTSGFVVTVVAITALIGLMGCSTSTPVGPSSAIESGEWTALLPHVSGDVQPASTTEAITASAGGEISLSGVGLEWAHLSVPAGALPNDANLTMTAPEGTVSELIFGPHGTEFNKPVTVTMAIEQNQLLDPGVTAFLLDVGSTYYDNEDEGTWDLIAPVSMESGQGVVIITVKLNHFSRYKTGSRGRSRH